MVRFEDLKMVRFNDWKITRFIFIISVFFMSSCLQEKTHKSKLTFETIDTDFSKGRLNHKQTININDLEKFHGHLCDGLVVGALAMQEGMKVLYPN